MSLPMPIKEGLKTTTEEAYDDKVRDVIAKADENFILIKADTEVDRCCFPFLYLLEYDSCRSHIFP